MPQVSLGPIEHVTRVRHEYDRTPPNLYNFTSRDTDLRRYIMREYAVEKVERPDEGAWVERNCVVIDGKFVARHDGMIVAEAAADKPVEQIEAALARYQGEDRIQPVREILSNDFPVIHIMKEGTANYGHVVVEMLPKLVNARKLGLTNVNILVPQEAGWAAEIIRQTARRVGLEPCVVLVDGASAIRVDELLLLSPVSQHNNRKSRTLLDLRDVWLSDVGRPSGAGRRIAVWRTPTEKRRLLNDPEVRRLLEKRRYKIVNPGEMSFTDQIRLFAEASEIVGLLGAGMTNCLFAPPEAKVFIIDHGIYDFFFWDLCCLNGQEFHWYFDKPIERFTFEMLSAPFRIDARRLDTALEIFMS